MLDVLIVLSKKPPAGRCIITVGLGLLCFPSYRSHEAQALDISLSWSDISAIPCCVLSGLFPAPHRLNLLHSPWSVRDHPMLQNICKPKHCVPER